MSEKDQLIALLKDPATVQKTVDKVFAEVDIDKNGFIERNEIKLMSKKLAAQYNAPEPTEDEISQAMAVIDTNKDGKISKEELSKVVKAMFEAILKQVEGK